MTTTERELQNLCKNICQLRIHNGIPKTKLAKALHISYRTLRKIEDGCFPPRLGSEVIVYAARTFHIRPSVLFCDELLCPWNMVNK